MSSSIEHWHHDHCSGLEPILKGGELIRRQLAIDALNEVVKDHSITDFDAIASILDLPSAQPDIIRCRNCKFASGDSRICMKFGHSPIGELDFCAWAERRTDE